MCAIAGVFYFQEAVMKNTKVTLVPLTADDREQFILDNILLVLSLVLKTKILKKIASISGNM